MEISITVTDRDNKTKKIIAPTEMNLNLMEILKVYEYPIEGTCGGMALCAHHVIFLLIQNMTYLQSHFQRKLYLMIIGILSQIVD